MNQQERILKSATEQFFQNGIKSVSMDDIASKLAISKKTIYKHFKDKKTIVKEVTKNMILHSEHICTEKCNKSTNAVDELLKLIDFINSFFINMNSTVMYDLEKYYPHSYVIFQEHQNVFLYNSLVNNLERGIKEELFRKNLNIEIIVRLRMGQIKLAFDQEFFPVSEFDIRKTQLASLDLYIMGIATCKGREIIDKHHSQKD